MRHNPVNMRDPTGLRIEVGGLSNDALAQLIASLERITGLKLRTERVGFLWANKVLASDSGDDMGATSGSALAREFLRYIIESPVMDKVRSGKTVRMQKPFVHDAPVLVGWQTYSRDKESGEVTEAVMALDPIDLSALDPGTPTDLREAFSLGFVFLHEAVHLFGRHDGPLHMPLVDDTDADPVGPVEAYINAMRKELCLPERSAYEVTKREGKIVIRFVRSIEGPPHKTRGAPVEENELLLDEKRVLSRK